MLGFGIQKLAFKEKTPFGAASGVLLRDCFFVFVLCWSLGGVRENVSGMACFVFCFGKHGTRQHGDFFVWCGGRGTWKPGNLCRVSEPQV